MRRLLFVLAVALCLPGQAAAGTLFLIDGRGWGHGVGLSQYGARGFAEAGWGYQRILAHYYRGTELRVVPARRVRVLLAEGRPAVKIGSTKPFRVVDARGKKRTLKPGVQKLVAGKLAKLRFPVRYEPGAAPLTLDGDAYRGALIVHRDGRHVDDRQQAPARPLPARRRPVGDAGRLAPGGAARPVGGGSLVRAGDAEAGHAFRPLRRHPQPGVRRHRRRGGVDEPRDRLDRRAGPRLERTGRDDLLPLDLRREDRRGGRGLAEGTIGAVPRLRAGPARQPFEASPLGSFPADARHRWGRSSGSGPSAIWSPRADRRAG